MLSAAFWIFVTLVAALGIGSIVEARLMRAESIDGSIRIVLARFGNAVLVVVAILIAMRLVDIDITVLSVFGGALGVGLGLGLQRIASNYVSGFIILLDRSLRIGDVITVDKYNGSVTQIRTRCTVVRAPNGVEALVPNELLLNQAVQNFSYGDKTGNAVTRIRVAFDTDIDHAMTLMLDAATAQPRVLASPAATVILKDFGDDGIELEATYWVPDPEAGVDGLRSDVNRAVWRAFKEAGIRVPVPAARGAGRRRWRHEYHGRRRRRLNVRVAPRSHALAIGRSITICARYAGICRIRVDDLGRRRRHRGKTLIIQLAKCSGGSIDRRAPTPRRRHGADTESQ